MPIQTIVVKTVTNTQPCDLDAMTLLHHTIMLYVGGGLEDTCRAHSVRAGMGTQ